MLTHAPVTGAMGQHQTSADTEVTIMDKQEAKALQQEIGDAVLHLFNRHGLEITSARSTYAAGEFNITIKSRSTDPALDPKVTDWKRWAASYGLPLDGLGERIKVGGVEYTITGLELSRRKFPVAVERFQDRKPFLLTIEAVRGALLGRKAIEAKPSPQTTEYARSIGATVEDIEA